MWHSAQTLYGFVEELEENICEAARRCDLNSFTTTYGEIRRIRAVIALNASCHEHSDWRYDNNAQANALSSPTSRHQGDGDGLHPGSFAFRSLLTRQCPQEVSVDTGQLFGLGPHDVLKLCNFSHGKVYSVGVNGGLKLWPPWRIF